jgi:hypothetical protein
MQKPDEKRTGKILAIRKRLHLGELLSAACAAEGVKPTTYLAWMRKYGPEGRGGEGYPRSIRLRVVLQRESEYITMGGPGTSFTARVTRKLVAEFRPDYGVELWFNDTSMSAWLSTEGRHASEGVGGGLRSLEEISDAVDMTRGPEGWNAFSGYEAAMAAAKAFPWLPESILEDEEHYEVPPPPRKPRKPKEPQQPQNPEAP